MLTGYVIYITIILDILYLYKFGGRTLVLQNAGSKPRLHPNITQIVLSVQSQFIIKVDFNGKIQSEKPIQPGR